MEFNIPIIIGSKAQNRASLSSFCLNKSIKTNYVYTNILEKLSKPIGWKVSKGFMKIHLAIISCKMLIWCSMFVVRLGVCWHIFDILCNGHSPFCAVMWNEQNQSQNNKWRKYPDCIGIQTTMATYKWNHLFSNAIQNKTCWVIFISHQRSF